MEQGREIDPLVELEAQLKEVLEGSVREAYWVNFEFTGEHLSLDPVTLGIEGEDVDKRSIREKEVIAKTICGYFGLPKRDVLNEEFLINEVVPEEVKKALPERPVRERVYKTNQKDILIHELLFSDGQKRYQLEVVIQD